MKGLAVLVLRYKQPGKRDFRVPLNFTIGNLEIPVGLGLITLVLFSLSIMNLFTKQVATIAGVAFTLIFFAVFEISEKITLKHGAKHQELDMFNLESDGELSAAALGVRPGNALVMIRNSNALYNLGAVLDRVNPHQQDVVVLLGPVGIAEVEPFALGVGRGDVLDHRIRRVGQPVASMGDTETEIGLLPDAGPRVAVADPTEALDDRAPEGHVGSQQMIHRQGAAGVGGATGAN